MNSRIFHGGHKVEDTPQFKTALEAQQLLLNKEFDEKLKELEKERQQLESNKLYSDQTKGIIEKQMYIMNTLTSKINERDDTILQLEEEIYSLQASSKANRMNLFKKSDELAKMQQLLVEHNIDYSKDIANNDSPKKANHGNVQSRYLPHHIECCSDNGKAVTQTMECLIC
jgi:kinesin family protein 3/17